MPLDAQVKVSPAGLVTFLLTDVEGSTPLWESDEATMAAATSRHDELVARAVAANGGDLLRDKGEGDSTFSVFAKASDAIGCAVELQRLLSAERWSTTEPLRVRVAVHTGQAYEHGNDYIGSAVNRTARLRGLASGGETLVSAATAALVRDHLPARVQLMERGYRELKGFSRGELIFEVWDPELPAASKQPSGTPRTAFPRELLTTNGLVGRSSQLESLLEGWEEATRGTCKSAFLSGEGGIGKTRLVAEFAGLTHERGAVVLYGACQEHGVPYAPFIQALQPLSDPGVEGLTGLDTPPSELLDEKGSVEGEAELLRLFDTLTGALGKLAEDKPLLVVLDDLHWAGTGTIHLLRHLLQRAPARVFVAGAFRDTDLPAGHPLADLLADLWRGSRPLRISLEGIQADSIAELLDEELRLTGTPALTLAAAIHTETGGNPFFVREVTNDLVSRRAIKHRSDGTAYLESMASIGLPDSVREVVERRLRSLAPTAQDALRLAAVAGPGFSTEVLERAGAFDSDVLDDLEQAIGSGLVREVGANFEFTHALVRATLLAALTSNRKARMHARIADALEGIPGTGIHDLAHHFESALPAGSPAKAVHYLVEAGRDLSGRFEVEEALAAFDRALSILDSLPEPNPAARIEVLIEKGWLHNRFDKGGYELLEGAALEARNAGELDLFATAVERALGVYVLGEPRPALYALADEAASAIKHIDEERAVLIELQNLGAQCWTEPDFRTWPQKLEQKIASIRRPCSDSTMGTAHEAMANALAGSPDIERRLQETRSAVERYQWSETNELWVDLAMDSLAVGDRNSFEEHRGQMDPAKYRDPMDGHFWANLRTAGMLLDGAFEAALAAALESLAGAPTNHLPAGAQVLWALYELGRIGEMQAVLQMAFDLKPIPALSAAKAVYLAEAGQLDEAQSTLDGMLANELDDIPRDPHFPYTLAWLAESACLIGDTRAPIVLQDLLAPYGGQLVCFATAAGTIGAADRYLAHLALLTGRRDEALSLYATALELEERVKSPPLAARTRVWFAEALDPVDPGKASALRAEALQTAERLGMTGLATRARSPQPA